MYPMQFETTISSSTTFFMEMSFMLNLIGFVFY